MIYSRRAVSGTQFRYNIFSAGWLLFPAPENIEVVGSIDFPANTGLNLFMDSSLTIAFLIETWGFWKVYNLPADYLISEISLFTFFTD